MTTRSRFWFVWPVLALFSLIVNVARAAPTIGGFGPDVGIVNVLSLVATGFLAGWFVQARRAAG